MTNDLSLKSEYETKGNIQTKVTERAMQRIAAIDIGTNSFHMVIAEIDSSGIINVLNREKSMVRLGKGGRDMKNLSEDAMARGVEALVGFSKIAEAEGAKVRAVATSAVREADNKAEFLDRVKEACGIDIEVISGIEEARIIYVGVINGLPVFDNQILLVDIGGGSTETVVGTKGNVLHCHSDKLGTIRLTERHLGGVGAKSKITKEQILNAEKHVMTLAARTFSSINKYGYEKLIGTSGTITNLVEMTYLRLHGSLPEGVNGLEVSSEEFIKTIEEIKTRARNGNINEISGLDSGRADIILAGAIIMQQYVEKTKAKSITISSYALREGTLYDTYQRAKKNAKSKEDNLTTLGTLRLRSVKSLAAKYGYDKAHTEFMLKLAEKFYDELKPIHKYNVKERELMTAAVYLHDVGTMISADSHHKHSHYIISNSNMPGYTYGETNLIGLIARYHRKSHPKKKHQHYAELSEASKEKIWYLASIIRICEGLERRQSQMIEDIKIKLTESKKGKNTIDITLIPKERCSDPEIEQWGGDMRKGMMEEAYNARVNINIYNN
ncbi:MAG: Ppx/GppA phosphatase family protein [Candidatus Kapaibacteriales bacterium]